jgi:hypothetical protein
MIMPQETDRFVVRNFTVASHNWVPGMVKGMAAGLGIAVLLAGSVSTLMATLLIGGVVGSLKSATRKAVQIAPIQDTNIRNYVFQALIDTSRKLDEIINIDEEFNAASSTGGGEKDRRAMKAQPQLKVAQPAPPKMGGM